MKNKKWNSIKQNKKDKRNEKKNFRNKANNHE